MQYCSLWHWTLLQLPITFTTGCCFFLCLHVFILSGVISPLISSSIWSTYRLGEFLFGVIPFGLFTLFTGLWRQEYWSGLPFPSLVDHVLSDLSTMTHPSWMAIHCMSHSFIELDKAVVHVIRLVTFLFLWFSVCVPSEKDERLMEAFWWERLTEGETVLFWWVGLFSLPVAWPEAKLWWR